MGSFTVLVSNISDYWEVRDEDGDLVADYVPASDIAKLFAAAPEMLEALKSVASKHSHIETANMPEWLDAVEDAIAKAEGRGDA
jgi:hypothetical protein